MLCLQSVLSWQQIHGYVILLHKGNVDSSFLCIRSDSLWMKKSLFDRRWVYMKEVLALSKGALIPSKGCSCVDVRGVGLGCVPLRKRDLFKHRSVPAQHTHTHAHKTDWCRRECSTVEEREVTLTDPKPASLASPTLPWEHFISLQSHQKREVPTLMLCVHVYDRLRLACIVNLFSWVFQ